jgi:CDP-diacylglycerol--glycerol-3-phosphate 3-phosphatidyltransferase
VSDLGKILDPMADSIYRLSIFLAFSLPPVSLPLWIIFIFLYRDIIISTLRTLCALKGFALAARTSGKIKAVWQAAASYAILFLMIPFTEGYLSQANLSMYSTWIAASAAFYSVFSGVDYILAHKQQLHRFCHK